ncbi:hypothetical protein LWC34_26935 [Kibdelosporangium philippinense]|uniref:Uncharacterized protein n=1 Tax=Kibdelosporangium philippinense TaxID=211113 RepID=A0ABS8ZF51_9PSEU|nr:hypothetical protein [Kibdelosporangium philippinense]MCE7006436.1 hypothetical protein [Kibdelosporangium philippinense]
MLDQAVDAIELSVRHKDESSYDPAIVSAWQAAQHASRSELDTALPRIAALLGEMPVDAAGRLPVLGGALVELGAAPGPLVPMIVTGLIDTLQRVGTFIETWPQGKERPAFDDDSYDETVSVLSGVHSEEDAQAVAFAWYAVGAWSAPAIAVLQHAEARADLPNRDALTELVERVGPLREDLGFLVELLAVLDNEQFVVLHRASGQGYELTVSGVSGNFQLQTLLAATLIASEGDGLIAGTPPDPVWVAAATDGDLRPAGGVSGQFNLVDHAGSWIWGEGRPADIPVLDGRRVVLLEPQPYPRTWSPGRLFERMRPTVQLDRILPSVEVAAWLTRLSAEQR